MGFLVDVSASIALVATVVKGKDNYRAFVTSGANVAMEPTDASGRLITFGTIDAAVKFVGQACPNVDVTVLLPITEGVKLYRKPLYASVLLANAALKARLMARKLIVDAAEIKTAQVVTDFVVLGYNTSVIPAVLDRYTQAVANHDAVVSNQAFLAAKIATL